MTIGSITVDLLARTGSFETDLGRAAKTAEKRAKEIDAAVTKAGAAVGAALGAAGIAVAYMAKEVIDGLDALNDVKDATGASIENISALEDVALRTGTTMENVSGILVKFNSALKEADGKNTVSQALRAIGLDAAELRKEDPAEALRKTAVALSGFADDGNKARLVQELFGKSIKEAAPFLVDLAEKTSLVGKVSAESAANAETFNKQIAELSKNALDAKRRLLGDMLPAINAVLKAMASGGVMGALDEFGERALGWTSNAKAKEISNLKSEIDSLARSVERVGMTPGEIVMTRPEDVADLARKRAELANKTKAFLSFTDKKYDQQGGVDLPKPEERPTAADVATMKTGAGKKDNSAAQEAKAQLAQDLEDMKKNTAALAGAFDNDEKILSAKRAASLISDADYYQKKREIIMATAEVEDAGLKATINRLKEEQATLSGKDAIDNQRKLNDAEADLRKSRADTSTQLKVLNIEAADSAAKLTNAMIDAREAAQSFLDTTNRARALEVAGLGQGAKTRDLNGAISQIEQTYEQKRQDLERDNRNGKFAGRQADYQRELALIQEFQKKSVDSYKDYYAQIELRQRSFTLGASEAARNYFDESRNVFKQTEQAVTSAFKGMEDALVNFVKTGKLDFKSLVDSIISDIARIIIRQQITGPLAGLLSSALGGGGGGFGTGAAFGNQDFGGFFAAGGSPPMGKVSIVGERGPELFVPNTAGRIIPNHELDGGGASVTVVNNWSVGDIPTVSMLKEAVAGSERRIAAAVGRSQRYGGTLA